MDPAGASYGDLLVTSLVVLGAVCVAAFLAVRLFGKILASGRARGAHLLDVVARVPLEPRRSLYVVEVAGKTLLVGTSEMGLNVLSELDASEVKARTVKRVTFADMVRAAWARRKTAGTGTGTGPGSGTTASGTGTGSGSVTATETATAAVTATETETATVTETATAPAPDAEPRA